MKLTKTTMLTIFSLLVPLSSSSTSVVDFCVADLSTPITPVGFPCKNPTKVTIDDFAFSGLGVAENTSNNIFNMSVSLAIDHTFPALNGLGLSMIRVDLGVGGVVPMHSQRSSELIVVIEGTIISGFVASDNSAYYKTLNKSDVMIFPPSLLRFQVNVGNINALFFASLNTAQPGFQFTTTSLAANDIPTEIVGKTTLLDSEQVQKLKSIFGGTN